jgi:AmmeMemoRadiSam system protein A
MGDQRIETCRALASGIVGLGQTGDFLIVASSDLSHYHDYESATVLDAKVIQAIKRWDYKSLSENFSTRKWEACGGGPIVTALLAAEELGANQANILKYANSGDIRFGDRSRVVGYVSVALSKELKDTEPRKATVDLQQEDRKTLLRIARDSVALSVRTGVEWKSDASLPEALRQQAAAFVTLKKAGLLRGCVGSVVAKEPLAEAVATAARNAALNDIRFSPVSEDEIPELDIEISVLSPFARIEDTEEIQPGRHGLLIEKGHNRGLLLPQVASDQNWDRETFLAHTCVKAGLPVDAWKTDVDLEIFLFSATVFGEVDAHHAGAH